jgi:hypothetical protein
MASRDGGLGHRRSAGFLLLAIGAVVIAYGD